MADRLQDEDFDYHEYGEDSDGYWCWFDEGDQPIYIAPHINGKILRDGQWVHAGWTPMHECARIRFSVWKRLVAEQGGAIPEEALNLPGRDT